MNLRILESDRGPAEALLDLVLSSSDHLWHNRPGVERDGRWIPRRIRGRGPVKGKPVKPGLHPAAAARLYSRLLEIYQLNTQLMAHFASYALIHTEWRDLKTACAALMLVQPVSGQPIHDDDGTVCFYDDDWRAIGEAMVLYYKKGSKSMMGPRQVLRVAELLECPAVANLNAEAGFIKSAESPSLGRWASAARQWLRIRDHNLPMLEGLVRAGYRQTIMELSRKCQYKPQSERFFEVLGWKQNARPHRSLGLGELKIKRRERFDGLNEEQVCERILAERLKFKDLVGRLPKELGLTPAIMVCLLPSLSDTELRLMTPTLETLGLLEDELIRARWEKALTTATDQRALNIAQNVRSEAIRAKLSEAADHAVRNVVEKASRGDELKIIFLIDKSGSMEAAIERSKEALARIMAGVPLERLHIATFDTMGTVLRPKAASGAAVRHMLKDLRARGGTIHNSALVALHESGLRFSKSELAILIVAGDEDGEAGSLLARTIRRLEMPIAAIAFIDCSAGSQRGETLRVCARELEIPFSEVKVEDFEDPYQITRVLKTLLETPVETRGRASSGWIEKVLATPLLQKPAL